MVISQPLESPDGGDEEGGTDRGSREAELDQEPQEQRYVIDSFVGQFQGGSTVAPKEGRRKASLYRRGQ